MTIGSVPKVKNTPAKDSDSNQFITPNDSFLILGKTLYVNILSKILKEIFFFFFYCNRGLETFFHPRLSKIKRISFIFDSFRLDLITIMI